MSRCLNLKAPVPFSTAGSCDVASARGALAGKGTGESFSAWRTATTRGDRHSAPVLSTREGARRHPYTGA